MAEKKIMLGNEAIARGAYEAGVKVSAAYPGTPSTEISENIVKYKEIYVIIYICDESIPCSHPVRARDQKEVSNRHEQV